MTTNPIFRPAWNAPRRVAGPVTRERVRARTRELALLAGRTPLEVAQCDYEQAKHEVTGESDAERQEAALVAASTIPAPGQRPHEPSCLNPTD